MQKISQQKESMNDNREKYEKLEETDRNKAIIMDAANLYNGRIDTARKSAGVNSSHYSCIIRRSKGVYLKEVEQKLIEIDKIKILKENSRSIHFTDGNNKYRYTFSDSQLHMEFNKEGALHLFDINDMRLIKEEIEEFAKLHNELVDICEKEEEERKKLKFEIVEISDGIQGIKTSREGKKLSIRTIQETIDARDKAQKNLDDLLGAQKYCIEQGLTK